MLKYTKDKIEKDFLPQEQVFKDFEIIDYIRNSAFYFDNTTNSIVTKSLINKCWITVRLNEENQIKEILITYYFVLIENTEIIVRNE
jgi:hypothetical protein